MQGCRIKGFPTNLTVSCKRLRVPTKVKARLYVKNECFWQEILKSLVCKLSSGTLKLEVRKEILEKQIYSRESSV